MGRTSRQSETIDYYQPEKGRALNTFNRILEISLDVIAKEGVEALNTNRIAADCGINISTLYHYFPNKDSILHALYTRWFDRLSAVAEKHRESRHKADKLKTAYKNYVLDLLRIDGFPPRAAVELERAIKTRKNLLALDNDIVERSITAYAEDILAHRPEKEESHLPIPSAFMLVSIWGAISIAADMGETEYPAIAEHCAEMMVALIRQ
ncbi:TetR/AcrR family transcriptional regulator [Halomonas sp. THAF12]|uniref:TetR/AcrR family transcriptional regulator n=1 Tax=Halomonas sp. B23F22_10 TaxID=3459515 RepID=UPI00373F26A3